MLGVDIYDIKQIHLDKQPRQVQLDLLKFTQDTIQSNKKYVLLDAPTGTGKSYYACMFMDWFKSKFDISAQFDVLTNSKILQEQYVKDYDFINSLWGRGSYFCEQYQCDCGIGSEWAKLQNKKCDSCPYSTAKYKFENGDVAMTNYHLFLTYMLYMPNAWKRSSRVLIIDEADSFDTVFCDFITTQFSKPLLKRNGFDEYEISSVLSELNQNPEDMECSDFVTFIEDHLLPKSKTVYNRLRREGEDGNKDAFETAQSLANHMQKWEMLTREWGEDPENWILESEKIDKTAKDGSKIDSYWQLTAQPVWGDKYLSENIWNRYDYIIFMSGTILDKNAFCKMNGLDVEDTNYICVDSPFPLENRPIYFFSKLGKQTFKTKEITWSQQKPVLEKIFKKYSKSKGICHVHNYQLQEWVVRDLKDKRILAHKSHDRSEIIQLHHNSLEPTILVSPSLAVGLDLSEDLSRHQTVLKMPYPNLGSKKNKRRMDTMKDWYSLQTVRTLIQSFGRSVRSETDKADTYILDGCFADVLKWSGHLIPKWIKDAIKWID